MINAKNQVKSVASVIFNGYKFGMLLQIAIGPVCFYIFKLATMNGFLIAMTGVMSAFLLDTLFVLGAIKGIAVLLESRRMQNLIKYFGSLVLLIFGIISILSQFDIHFLPALVEQNVSSANNAFIQTAIITLSNPLTIIFWAGVFSAKISEGNLGSKDVYIFGLGAVLATLSFLSLIALTGSYTTTFLSPQAIKIINILVGFILMYFGFKILMKKYVIAKNL